MKCKIQWIDEEGNPTPDQNEAIGVVQCTGFPVPENPMYRPEPSGLYPICADHLKQMPDTGEWVFTPFERSDNA